VRVRLVRTAFVSLVLAMAATLPAAGQKGSAARANQKPVWPDEGPAVWAPRPTVAEITANDLRTRLYGFADDSMLGRRVGELGNLKGTAYIAAEYKRLGLKPAGENGTFFQDLPFGPVGFDRASSKLVVAGRSAAAGQDWIPLTPSAANAIGGTANLSNVTAVFAGQWGDQTRLDPATFRGKVAVFIGGPSAGVRFGGGRGGARELPGCGELPDRFGAEAVLASEAALRSAGNQGAQGQRGRGGQGQGPVRDTRAMDAGAVAVLFVNLDDDPDAAASAFATRNTMRPDPMAPGIPAAASINRASAERIFGKPLAQLAVGTAGKAVSGQWDYAWRMSEWPGRNVIGIIPGSDPAKANEYILISAHNDHVGINSQVVDHDSLRAVNMVTRRQGANDPVCRPTAAQQHQIDSLIARARSIRPPRRDSIMNGADDDGSGTVIMLEVAEQLAAEHPGRSVIFVSHEGEEGGLLGSRWFTDHPTIPLESVAAALNMDMEAKGRTDQVKYGGPTSIQILGARRLSVEFGSVIDSVNAVRPVVMAIDRSWDVAANPLNRFCRSDQVNYVHHDVPVAYFSTGYAEDYHQQTDEPQYADYDHMARIGGFIHDITMALATRRNRPAISGADPNYPQCR
jgi:Peptidase family M28